jgi:hypothetical protein
MSANMDIWRLLREWRGKKEKCVYNERYMCPPCIAGYHELCISLSGTGKLFNQMTDGQIGKINRLLALVFSDFGPWHLPGRLYGSLGDFLFTLSNYSTHHALGTLADQLVQEGMLLDADTAVEDDRLRDEAADQKHPAVDNVKLV